MLECPIKEVRVMFARLLEEMINSFLIHGGVCVSIRPMVECVYQTIVRVYEYQTMGKCVCVSDHGGGGSVCVYQTMGECV